MRNLAEVSIDTASAFTSKSGFFCPKIVGLQLFKAVPRRAADYNLISYHLSVGSS